MRAIFLFIALHLLVKIVSEFRVTTYVTYTDAGSIEARAHGA